MVASISAAAMATGTPLRAAPVDGALTDHA
jgi:hypothetical protein